MDISITGATSNRSFAKTCVRLSQSLNGLRQCCASIDASEESFDVLQLVFVDEPESFIQVAGVRGGDRLYQASVGMPMDGNFGPSDDRAFLRTVGAQVLRVIEESPLGAGAQRASSGAVTRWLESIS